MTLAHPLEWPIDKPRATRREKSLFHVTLEGDFRVGERTWSGEVRVDGVHDAELTIVTD